VNVYDEWPMSQESFDKYLLEKYTSYNGVYSTHHYETIEVKDSSGNIIVKSGLVVPSSFNVRYFDYALGQDKQVFDITTEISNYDYEVREEEKKRNIFLLKSDYVSIIMNDMETKMPYKEGGDQYIDPTLKRVDDIRLYEN
jgi:hypothetical protein